MEECLKKGQILKLPDFKGRAGLKDWAWRTMRRNAEANGYTICHKVGRVTLVDVDAWLAYLQSKSETGDTHA